MDVVTIDEQFIMNEDIIMKDKIKIVNSVDLVKLQQNLGVTFANSNGARVGQENIEHAQAGPSNVGNNDSDNESDGGQTPTPDNPNGSPSTSQILDTEIDGEANEVNNMVNFRNKYGNVKFKPSISVNENNKRIRDWINKERDLDDVLDVEGGIESNLFNPETGEPLEEEALPVTDYNNENGNDNEDEFNDKYCMGLNIKKTSKVNECYDGVDLTVFIDKIGLDAIVVSSEEINKRNIAKAVPLVMSRDGILIPRYKVYDRSIITYLIGLHQFMEVKVAVKHFGQPGNYFVLKKDKNSQSYNFHKIKVEAGENSGFDLEEGDRVAMVDIKIFNFEFGAFLDKNGDVQLRFLGKTLMTINGVVDKIKDACCCDCLRF